jgi:hypothetical protein
LADGEWSGHNQQGKAQMKTILMLIVGLMLAGCDQWKTMFKAKALPQPPCRDRGDWIAVDTICACLDD